MNLIQVKLFTSRSGNWLNSFGGKVNWIQTDPSRGWNMLWRAYGPLQTLYDKTWRPSEIEMVK